MDDDEPPPQVPAPRPVPNRGQKFEPTVRQRELVAMMVANHVPHTIIALSLGIGDRTFDRHFVNEVKYGRSHMVARVGVGVLRKALKGNMNAARYWLMTHGGPEWKVATKDAAAEAAAFSPADTGSRRKVQFYIPTNGRDRPETPEPPLIDGDLGDTGT